MSVKEPTCWEDRFNLSWLYTEKTILKEFPQRLNQPSLYDQIVMDINSFVQYGEKERIKDLGDGWMKYNGIRQLFYWYEKNEVIIVGAQLELQGGVLIVNYVAKNPEYIGKPPFACDLYDKILHDNKHAAIRLSSDKKLSDDGFKIWVKLLAMGHKICVYNNKDPGKTFLELQNYDDLKAFFSDDAVDKNYQFILTESMTAFLETKCDFDLYRIRQLSGYFD